jgi:hypothetical protein
MLVESRARRADAIIDKGVSVLLVLVELCPRQYTRRWIRTTALWDMNPPELSGYPIPLVDSPFEMDRWVAPPVIHANSGEDFSISASKKLTLRSQQ